MKLDVCPVCEGTCCGLVEDLEEKNAKLGREIDALSSEREWWTAVNKALLPYQELFLRLESKHNRLKSEVGSLLQALKEIESFPISGYHAGAAQRIARAAINQAERTP